MKTLLIILLLLYNVWLVTYILFGKRHKSNPSQAEKPPARPPADTDGIVGKSRFKMELPKPMSAKSTPNTATAPEGEVLDDIAVTFAEESSRQAEEQGSARLSDDELDDAFSDIRISDIPMDADQEQEMERTHKGRYASGASFDEIGEAVNVADNPAATTGQRQYAGGVFSEIEGNQVFEQIIESNSERAKRIMGFIHEFSDKAVRPSNKTEVEIPADISGFDIRDFV